MYFGKVNMKKNDRVPPNQNVTTTFPVLHHGNVPYYKDLNEWTLRIFGEVKKEMVFSFTDLMELPQTEYKNDIHCVTGWSRLDNTWSGISSKTILETVELQEGVEHVIFHAEEGWSTNIPIEDFAKETSLLAYSFNGEPLTPEHGYPLRAVIPHLYFWKSAKWVRGIEFSKIDKPGFWEKNGYHNYGNPWKEERFTWD